MLLAQGAINTVGGLMSSTLWENPHMPLLMVAPTLTIVSGILTFFAVANLHKPISDRAASIIFGVNVIPVYFMLYSSGLLYSAQQKIWTPFEPHELSCLTIAILAPPNPIIGVTAILLLPALAVFQYLNFSPELTSRMSAHPYLAPIAFGVFSVILYFFRLRGIRIADLVAKQEAEAEMAKTLTRTILAIKDMANSPIQSLTLDAETLRRRHPENLAIAKRIERSTIQLRNLNRILDDQIRG